MSNLENPRELICGKFLVPIMNITRSTSKSLKIPCFKPFFSVKCPKTYQVEVEIVYSITFKLWKITEITHFWMIFAPKSLTEGLL